MNRFLMPLFCSALCFACASQSKVDDVSSTSSAVSTAATTTSTGTLDCAPTTAQTTACTGLAAGDACTLALADGGTGAAGTCRTTYDGSAIACAPTPPAPPSDAVAACTGKSSGDTCAIGTRSGTCASIDSELACIPAPPSPPQTAIDACADLASGAACTVALHGDAGTVDGSCTASTSGAIFCKPTSPRITACASLASGAACTIGSVSGTCETQSGGTTIECITACGSGHPHDGPGFGGPCGADGGVGDGGTGPGMGGPGFGGPHH